MPEQTWLVSKDHERFDGVEHSEILMRHRFLAEEAHAEGWTVQEVTLGEVWPTPDED